MKRYIPIGIFSLFCLMGCSDFYANDFIHIPSAQYVQEEEKIQAMRKSQILENNRTQILMVVYYINEISNTSLEHNKEEIFLVEIYARSKKIYPSMLSFTLSNTYKKLQAKNIAKVDRKELGSFAPDIIYNQIYKVSFQSIGLRGRDNLKLSVYIQDMGKMDFDFGYTKRKSGLTK